MRHTVVQNNSIVRILEKFQQYFLDSTEESEWPGTRLHDGSTATVFQFRLNSNSASLLTQTTEGFLSWIQPEFPEDLCLMRFDGTPWLITISHEKDVYFEISTEERTKMIDAIPNLGLLEI